MRARERSIALVPGAVLGLVTLLAPASVLAREDVALHDRAPAAEGEGALLAMADGFVAACRARDLDRLAALWNPSTPHRAEGDDTLQRDVGPGGVRISVRDVQANGDRATVHVVLDLDPLPAGGRGAIGSGRFRRAQRRLEVRREAGAWTVWRYRSLEDELVDALLAAPTDEERQARLDARPEIDAAELVRVATARGAALVNAGRPREGRMLMSLALRLAEPIETRSVVAGLLSRLAMSESDLGEPAAALQHGQRGLALAEEAADKLEIWRATNHLGIIRTREGSYRAAQEQYARSLRMAEDIGDPKLAISILNNLGGLAHVLGDEPAAIDYYTRTLTLAEAAGDLAALSAPLNNLGNAYFSQGDYARALLFHQRGVTAAEKVKSQLGLLGGLSGIGEVHSALGNHAQAIAYLERARQVAEASGERADLAVVVYSLGVAHLQAGHHDQALAAFETSLALDRELGARSSMAQVLAVMGHLHHQAGEPARALAAYQEGLTLAEETGDVAARFSVMTGLAAVRHQMGEFPDSLEWAGKAVSLGRQAGLGEGLPKALLALGRAQRALGRAEEARRTLTEAVDAIEALRVQTTGQAQSAQRFFENKLDPYHELVALRMEAHDAAGALLYAERAKGRVLLDTLQGGRADLAARLSPAEREQELRLERDLRALNVELSEAARRNPPDAARRDELQARRDRTRLEYEAFETGLHAAHPELRLGRGDVRSFAMADLDDRLIDARTALLEFVVTEARAYLFVLTRADAQAAPRLFAHVLEVGQPALAERVRRFRDRLGRRDLGFEADARDLYRLLLAPAESELRGKDTLVLVPDDVLWQVPFQALAAPSGRYVLDDHAVYSVPSLAVLRELRATTTASPAAGPGPRLLALGNPSLDLPAAREQAAERGVALVSLPEAEEEVRDIEKLYGPAKSAVFVGPAAGEARLKKEIGGYDVVHLAAHAILDDVSPLYSHLVLSPEGDEDGLLEAWEVTRLRIPARLVVLSACQTAGGHVAPGEGMVGMAWAFAIAGCPTTVVSQWPVDSAGTRKLMVAFHRRLGGRAGARSAMMPAQALRAAALEMRRQPAYRHPFYWASFVVVGDGGRTAPATAGQGPAGPRATAGPAASRD